MPITATERARQAGYDDGYGDGRAVEQQALVQTLAAADFALYRRPDWMAERQWQNTSADLTEQWLILLERAAQEAAR